MSTQTCAYVARRDDPESWHGTDQSDFYLDRDVDSRGLGIVEWRCPHPPLEHDDPKDQYCVFHTDPKKLPDEISERDALLEALDNADDGPWEGRPEHRGQFVGATFGAIDLSSETIAATDDHDIRFDHAQFKADDGDLNFNHTTIETRGRNPISFYRAEFISVGDSDVRFEGATFQTDGDGDVWFRYATFRADGNVRFEGATFRTDGDGHVRFVMATFQAAADGDVRFEGATFQTDGDGDVRFRLATFRTDGGGEVDFWNATFRTDGDGNMWFDGVTFQADGDGDVAFPKATFRTDSGGDMWFDGVTFQADGDGDGDVGFWEATFRTDGDGRVGFMGLEFSDVILQSADLCEANLSGVDLTGSDLREADISEVSVNGETTCEHLYTDFKSNTENWDATARAYHNLKTVFSNHGLVGKARKMHVQERRARSEEAKAANSWSDRKYLRSQLSWIFTGYGVQVRNLLGWMVALFLLSTAVYVAVGVEDTFAENVSYSVLAYTVAPPAVPSGIGTQIVMMVETFFGTLSIVLLGYILGNRERF